MTAFRITDQDPVYFDLTGNVAAGGYLKFYETGTTTPKDVYGEEALATNNGSTINLGADGRAVYDIWGDGSYRVRLYASDDTLISEADDVAVAAGAGASIPPLSALKFLTNDGAVMSWQSVREVPDPTGSSGKILGTDGDVLLWQAAPTAPTVTGAGQVRLGDVLIQTGSATIIASNASTGVKSFTFPTPFSTLWHVGATANTGSDLTSVGYLPIISVNGRSVNGATVNIDVNETQDIITDVPFTWFAIGLA